MSNANYMIILHSNFGPPVNFEFYSPTCVSHSVDHFLVHWSIQECKHNSVSGPMDRLILGTSPTIHWREAQLKLGQNPNQNWN